MHVSHQPIMNVRCISVRLSGLEMTNAKRLSVTVTSSVTKKIAQAHADAGSLQKQ